MKQYKLTAWPDLPARLQKTASRRAVSQLSQRFVSPRDLARSCGASGREVGELIDWLQEHDLLMVREAPHAVRPAALGRPDGGLLAVFRGLVRSLR